MENAGFCCKTKNLSGIHTKNPTIYETNWQLIKANKCDSVLESKEPTKKPVLRKISNFTTIQSQTFCDWRNHQLELMHAHWTFQTNSKLL